MFHRPSADATNHHNHVDSFFILRRRRILPRSILNRDFFPVAISFMRSMPVIGNILSLPYITDAVDKLADSTNKLPV